MLIVVTTIIAFYGSLNAIMDLVILLFNLKLSD